MSILIRDAFTRSHASGALPLPIATVLVLALGCVFGAPAHAQSSSRDSWSTDGPVGSIVESGESVFLGGHFSHLVPPTSGALFVDAASGVAKGPFPSIIGTVFTGLEDGRGGWFLGGQFEVVQGQPRQNLAHIDASGLVTGWNPGANGRVWKLVRHEATIYVCGEFGSVGGESRQGLAAVESVSGKALAWNPRMDGWAKDALVNDTTLFVAGAFTQIGDSSRTGVGEIELATARATPWQSRLNGSAYALQRTANTLFVGGTFNLSAWPRAQQNLVALDLQFGGMAFSMPTTDGPVYALALMDTTLYIGGSFENVDTRIPRARLAAVGASSGALLPWAPAASNQVTCLHATTSEILVGGYFNTIADSIRTFLAAVDPLSGRPSAWRCAADRAIWGIHRSGSSLFLLGDFTYAGALERRNLAAIDRTTGQPLAWHADADDDVTALACAGGRVFVGGRFKRMGGVPRRYLAAVDEGSARVLSWAPNPNNLVRALCAVPDRVVAGGEFTSIAGIAANYFAIIDAGTGLEAAPAPRPNRAVQAFSLMNNRIYVSGEFTRIGTAERLGLGAYASDTGDLLSWNPMPNGPVGALVASGPNVYVVGNFDHIGTTAITALAEIDTALGMATAFRANVIGTPGAIAATPGRLFVAGSAGYPLAQIDLASGQLVNLDLSGTNNIYTLAAGKRALKIGGLLFPGGYALRGYRSIPVEADSLRIWPRTIATGETTLVAIVGEALDDCDECQLVRSDERHALRMTARGLGVVREQIVFARRDVGEWQLECRHRDGHRELGSSTRVVKSPSPAAKIRVSGPSRVRPDTWATYFVAVTGDSLRTAHGRIEVLLSNVAGWQSMPGQMHLAESDGHGGLQLYTTHLIVRPRQAVGVGFKILTATELGAFGVVARWSPVNQEVQP